MKRAVLSIVVMIIAALAVIAVGHAAEPTSALKTIEASSPCPVVGCASGSCHGFADVPEPDGVHEMVCPEAGCASLECHAWDTLATRYHQASDASLNIWILMPVALVVGLVVLVRMLSRPKAEDGEAADD